MNDAFYTPIGEAQAVMNSRTHLRKEVEKYWESEGLDMSQYVQLEGFAGFARQVPTFRMEDGVFATLASAAGLQPVWMGYTSDKFSTLSSTKRSYLQPTMWSRNNSRGEPIVVKKKMCDVNAFVGARLDTITDKVGGSMINWHRERLLQMVPDAIATDDSKWMLRYGSPDRYYESFLSVFVTHGVLFEDYHGGESGNKLDAFTSEIFEPTVERLRQRFGFAPNLVRMPWHADMGLYPDGEVAHSWRTLALKYIQELDL